MGILAPAGVGAEERRLAPPSLNTNLFAYVQENNILAVRSVIEAGADLGALNAGGQSPLDLAVARGHYKIANYLIWSRQLQVNRATAGTKDARHLPPAAGMGAR